VVDLPIPGNDDSIRSIELVVHQLADAILEGKASTASEAQRQKSEVGQEQPVG
jgi:small subunit ribosomal protein S2